MVSPKPKGLVLLRDSEGLGGEKQREVYWYIDDRIKDSKGKPVCIANVTE